MKENDDSCGDTMILEKHIDVRIAGLTAEIQSLVASHNALLETISKNQTRFAQLTGAIDELKKLKGTKNEPSNNDNTGGNAGHPRDIGGVSHSHPDFGRDSRAALGCGELDKPDTSAD